MAKQRRRIMKTNGSGDAVAKRYAMAPVELTEAEMAERSNQLAALLDAIDGQKDALKAYAKGERDEIKGKEQEAKKLYTTVLNGTEDREVEVMIQVKGNQVITYRAETGEVIETRAATEEDRQAGLFG